MSQDCLSHCAALEVVAYHFYGAALHISMLKPSGSFVQALQTGVVVGNIWIVFVVVRTQSVSRLVVHGRVYL